MINGHATGYFSADGADKKFSFRCQILSGATTLDDQDAFGASTNVFLFTIGEISIPFNETITLSAPTTVTLKCAASHAIVAAGSGVMVNAGGASFNAVAVGSIG